MMSELTPKPRSNIFWILVIGLLIIVGAYWFTQSAGETEQAVPEARTTPSTEWTTAPEDEGVEVELPETAMTNVPADRQKDGHEETGAGE